ncbi:hypothetical protein G7054_g13328 [Neopestalotiopsis clavispora]|nr:hypothetical protein G7054_g13328 [Neopestalotiopsis clavispora]
MEPEAKRRKLDAGDVNSDDSWSSSRITYGHLQSQNSSSEFFGTGVSNNNGNLNIGGNLYMNANTGKDWEAEREKRYMKLLESLRFEQIESRQLSIRKAHANTCHWLLSHPVYMRWENMANAPNDQKFLWIRGKPGAGKSTLMKYLSAQLQKRSDRQGKPDVLISFFFNARGNDLEKSTEGMYRSLLLQLLKVRPELHRIFDRFQLPCHWDIDQLRDLFEQAVAQSNTICLIDALDECKEAEVRDMVNLLDDIIHCGSQLHVCFASRHYPRIRIRTELDIVLEDQDQHRADIARYINTKLHIGHGDLAKKLRGDIQEKACGVFMWVALVVEILNTEYDKGNTHHLRERFQQIPDGLHELFHSILVRSTGDQNELLLCLQWILFSTDPLTPKELYFAIISGSQPNYLVACHSGEISEKDMRRYILDKSRGLANVSGTASERTVQFIHESVKDFLLKGQGLQRVFSALVPNILGASHEALKSCCLNYLQMLEVIDSDGSQPDAEKFPLLGYSTESVLYHADQAESNGLTQKEFVASFPKSSWVKYHNQIEDDSDLRLAPDVTMMYILSIMRASSLIRHIPSEQSCFDAEDSFWRLPIIAAIHISRSCAEEMLRIQAQRVPDISESHFRDRQVLEVETQDHDHEIEDFDLSIAKLCFIVAWGGESVSLFFLKMENASVDSKGPDGCTAAMYAAQSAYGNVLEELHRQGANLDAVSETGNTALHYAAGSHNFALVEQLLEYGADASVVNCNGVTPLHLVLASSHGLKSAERMLNRGADIAAVDNQGSTPLHYWSSYYHSWRLGHIAQEGHLKGTRLLIDYGADISAVDANGLTALHHICGLYSGTESAKLLLDRGADVTAVDNEGRTPLHHSSYGAFGWRADVHLKGYVELTRLLLDHGADIHAADKEGLTPLHLAVDCSHLDLCQMLLRLGADPLATDNDEATPMLLAMMRYEDEYWGAPGDSIIGVWDMFQELPIVLNQFPW